MPRSEHITSDTKVIPRPVFLVMDKLSEVSDAYASFRPEASPVDAFLGAIAAVLNEPDAREVYRFLRGEDPRFPGDMGKDFTEKTIEHLETAHKYQRGVAAIVESAPVGRTTPQPTKDVVDLAEWIAGNNATSYIYRHMQADFPDIAAKILESAVQDIVAVAGRAWTQTGRKVKIEQAEKVVVLLGNKARAHPDPAAINQVVWCEALADALRPLRK